MTKNVNPAKVKSKKVTKKQETCKWYEPVILLLLIFGTLTIAYYFLTPSTPKFKKGDCLIDRYYNFQKVDDVWEYSGNYDMKEQKPVELTLDGKLTGEVMLVSKQPYWESSKRPIKWADTYYTKIPCTQIVRK